MIKSLFPDSMLSSSTGGEHTVESIASKLIWFELQLHMVHWQTLGYSEHQAMNFYDTVHDFTDTFIEKLMGYSRRKIKDLKIPPIIPNTNASNIVNDLISYCEELCIFAKANNYSDLDNMAQDLSGSAAQTLFLLTLS
jgi:hypothetical protein